MKKMVLFFALLLSVSCGFAQGTPEKNLKLAQMQYSTHFGMYTEMIRCITGKSTAYVSSRLEEPDFQAAVVDLSAKHVLTENLMATITLLCWYNGSDELRQSMFAEVFSRSDKTWVEAIDSAEIQDERVLWLVYCLWYNEFEVSDFYFIDVKAQERLPVKKLFVDGVYQRNETFVSMLME